MPNSPARHLDPARPVPGLDGRDRRPAQGDGPGPRGGLGLRLGRGRPALSDRRPGRVPVGRQGPRQDPRGRAISDDGSLVALLGEGSRLWLLDGDFELIHERSTIADPLAIAVDPHGRYVAVSSKMNVVQFYTRHAKHAGKFETRQPLSQHGLRARSACSWSAPGPTGRSSGSPWSPGVRTGQLDGAIVWNEALMSGVGRLATTGDGQMILLACFTHGVQRYDIEGEIRGAYHLGGSAGHAVPDFAGRSIAVSTTGRGAGDPQRGRQRQVADRP